MVHCVPSGHGLEAYRLLNKWYAARTHGTNRVVLKLIINNPQAKKISKIEATVLRVESRISRNEAMAGALLPYDLKVTIYSDLCHKDLEECLKLSFKDLDVKSVR